MSTQETDFKLESINTFTSALLVISGSKPFSRRELIEADAEQNL